VKVEIWSDVVCPWCYIGKRRFEAALARFAHRDQVEVEWKSFELDPTSQTQAGGTGADYADRLASKYGMSRTKAQEMLDAMTGTAAAEGLDFHFERAEHANTFAAHQVIHLAAEHGVQDAVKERLLRAYFTEGEAVGDAATLARLAAEAGLDAGAVAEALADERFAAAVRADESDATALGITGVPFFVVDRTYGVSGAQPADELLALLEHAWASRKPLTVVSSTSGAEACGPDGCAV
jgi:predicted DsbA family dithiol-disulfide isomerase